MFFGCAYKSKRHASFATLSFYVFKEFCLLEVRKGDVYVANCSFSLDKLWELTKRMARCV